MSGMGSIHIDHPVHFAANIIILKVKRIILWKSPLKIKKVHGYTLIIYLFLIINSERNFS